MEDQRHPEYVANGTIGGVMSYACPSEALSVGGSWGMGMGVRNSVPRGALTLTLTH